jgi:hypothetical protein
MAQTTFLYPTNVMLTEIAQDKLPTLTLADPIFRHFPMVDRAYPNVMWEQMDNYVGLQQARGIGGSPTRVKKTGAKRWTFEPGYYGEFELIDEVELTLRRPYGQWSGGIDIGDLIMRYQDKLLNRRLDRIRKIIWDLVKAGTFSVASPEGGTIHTDIYPIQTFDATVGWGTPLTSTPLADFRAVQLKHRGHSVSFGSGSEAFMNQVTVNHLLSNTNQTDVAGRRVTGLLSVLNLDEINRILAGENLPTIVVYDEGYLDESSVFQPFIPDDFVIVIGKRTDGSPLGEYQMTLNVNNPDMGAGAYMKVIDHGDDRVPRTVEIHDGHNGGPAMFFPSGVVTMDVT